jgi:Cd2+/Zn2+-exporting ATPase
MGDDLGRLPFAIRLARRTMGIIRQNIAAALIVKALFLVLTFAGVTNLWLAVFADMGMSLLVTANALRVARNRHAPRGAGRQHPTGSPAPAIS